VASRYADDDEGGVFKQLPRRFEKKRDQVAARQGKPCGNDPEQEKENQSVRNVTEGVGIENPL